MLSFLPIIRNIRAEGLFEAFLVSAVAAVPGIRAFLFLVGYPQIGGAGFHVAHMLFGGIFMAAALLICFPS